MQVRCDICGELLSGLVLFHMTHKHEAMVESFLTSAVEELEGSVVPAEMGMLRNSKAYTFDSEAGTRDLTGSGLEHFPCSRKSFSEAGTSDMTGSGLEHFPCSRKSFSEAGTSDMTGSGLEHFPCSRKSFSEAGTSDMTGSGLEHFPCSRKSFTKEATIPSSGGDLTSDETEHLLKLLEDVAHMLYWREEDEEFIGMIHTMMDRLLDNDTAEIAEDARHAIPHLHNLWCTNAHDLTADDTDTAPRSGTRQCAIQDLSVDLHHAVKVFDQFAGWMVPREASISSVVPPLGHVKHTKGQSGARSACKSFVSASGSAFAT